MLATIIDLMRECSPPRVLAVSGLREATVIAGARLRSSVLGFCLLALVIAPALTPTRTLAAQRQTSLLVVEAGTGRTLRSVGADVTRYPASLTKMMTLYLLFEAIDRKQIKLNSRMRVSGTAAAKPPTELGLSPGQTITVQNAILAITTESANDMAALVGETLAGSEARFASRMTAKARALGMRRTTFGNASGLPHPAHRTTARDMAILGRALLRDFPHYYHYFGKRQFHYAGATHHNHNRLLGVYRGMDGIKTGFTRASGYNLVASAKRDGRRLIGVVMGSSSAFARNQTMARLLDDGFRNPTVTAKKRAPAAQVIKSKPSETRADRRASLGDQAAAKNPRLIASR